MEGSSQAGKRRFSRAAVWLAIAAILPWLACLSAGSPKGTSAALFVALFAIGVLWFRGVGKPGRGVALRPLGLAAMAFAPLVISLLHGGPRGTQAALLASYVMALFFVLQALERRSCLLFHLLAWPMVCFAAVNSAYWLMTGDFPGYQAFASVIDTNPREAGEFMRSPFFRRFALALGGAVLVGGVYARVTRNLVLPGWLVPSWLVKAAAVAVWVSTLWHLSRASRPVSDYYPALQAKQLMRYYDEVHRWVSDYRALEYRFTGEVNRERKCTCILVIGEAMRRDKLGIHGSGIDTTPRLEAFARGHPGQLLVFTDAVAASSFTRVSVPLMLSTCHAAEYHEIARKPAIPMILRAAGVDAELFSNQAEKGYHDNLISAFMADLPRRQYLSRASRHFDEDLVPLLARGLAANTRLPRLRIVHLAGSHYDYQYNYPSGHGFHEPASTENHYYNSLRYTDHVIGLIHEQMMAREEPCVLLYASDHGEYLNDFGDGFYDHGNRNHLTRFEIEIPFLISFNDAFLKQRADDVKRMRQRVGRPVSHDNISHTILGLAGVRDSFYCPEMDLSSPEWRESPRYIVERDDAITPLEKVKFDETKFTGRLD